MDTPDVAQVGRFIMGIVRSLLGNGRPCLRRQFYWAQDPVARLRAEIAIAESGHNPWQDLTVEFIRMTNDWLIQYPPSAWGEFWEAVERVIYRYLTAMPVGNARKLLSLADAGRLAVHRRRPAELSRTGNQWTIRWQDGSCDQFDAVVYATGYHEPAMRSSGGRLLIAERHSGIPPTLAANWRVDLGQGPAELVFAVGACSVTRAPLMHAVVAATPQISDVMRQLSLTVERASRQR